MKANAPLWRIRTSVMTTDGSSLSLRDVYQTTGCRSSRRTQTDQARCPYASAPRNPVWRSIKSTERITADQVKHAASGKRTIGEREKASDQPAETGSPLVTPECLRRFHGSVVLDPVRMGAEAGKIAQEVIVHLANLRGAVVEVTLEIHASFLDGVPQQIVQVVNENCRVLKFKTYGFEKD